MKDGILGPRICRQKSSRNVYILTNVNMTTHKMSLLDLSDELVAYVSPTDPTNDERRKKIERFLKKPSQVGVHKLIVAFDVPFVQYLLDKLHLDYNVSEEIDQLIQIQSPPEIALFGCLDRIFGNLDRALTMNQQLKKDYRSMQTKYGSRIDYTKISFSRHMDLSSWPHNQFDGVSLEVHILDRYRVDMVVYSLAENTAHYLAEIFKSVFANAVTVSDVEARYDGPCIDILYPVIVQIYLNQNRARLNDRLIEDVTTALTYYWTGRHRISAIFIGIALEALLAELYENRTQTPCSKGSIGAIMDAIAKFEGRSGDQPVFNVAYDEWINTVRDTRNTAAHWSHGTGPTGMKNLVALKSFSFFLMQYLQRGRSIIE